MIKSTKIPKQITNSELIYLIDEYVRLERDRDILKDKWFKGLSIEQLAEKYKLSETTIKNVEDAIKKGFHIIETEIILTKDNIPIIYNGNINICKYTLLHILIFSAKNSLYIRKRGLDYGVKCYKAR